MQPRTDVTCRSRPSGFPGVRHRVEPAFEPDVVPSTSRATRSCAPFLAGQCSAGGVTAHWLDRAGRRATLVGVPSPAAPLPPFRLANAHFVTDRIAVGGDLAPEFSVARRQLQELVDAGITHIADLRDEWNDAEVVRFWAPQIGYLYHPVEDAGQRIPGQWFEELNDWVSEVLQDPDAKVLVHCHMGVNRGPSAAFALLLGQGMSVRDALSAIRANRAVAVIDYADDALDWYLAREGADRYARAAARRSLTMWRKANAIDKFDVIRQIRATEGGGSSWCVTLGREAVAELDALVTASPNPTIGIVVDWEPDELAVRDEVVLWDDDSGSGVVGFGWVVGPPREADGATVLPVVTMGFSADGLLPAEVLEMIAPGVGFGSERNPTRLSGAQVTALNTGLRLLARAAAMRD